MTIPARGPAAGLPPQPAPEAARGDLIAELGRIVGSRHVLTSARDTRGYTRGFATAAAGSPRWCAPAASSNNGAFCRRRLRPGGS